ncbi:MAG: serine/threonine protein kinase [Nitrosomonadales bacterium]|nr:serine/threonine protein kinase [Nitrosomonadales bacterium]
MITQLGRYEIISELGQGAMGVVYKARDPLIDRILAIKTISLNLALDEREEYEARFYQEAKAAGRLSHPNIVTVYDLGKTEEVAYIAMEFLQGRELRDILDDGQQLSVDQVLDIVAQVGQGLAYAHEHGIVHRDVKPSNIMVTRDGHVKITDFGIARMASSSVRTQTGMILGSPKYMSPEQVMGKKIDQRSDIFSLGVMLYEMLTSQPPFAGENINAIMFQTVNAVPPPPSSLNPVVPDMLNFIIAKALAKNVDERYQHATEFVRDVRACRDILPRATAVEPFPHRAHDTPADVIPMGARFDAEAADAKPEVNMGLSKSFDSAGATMRLAAMTNASAVEGLASTFKMAHPTADELRQLALAPSPKSGAYAVTPNVQPVEEEHPPASVSNWMLVMIVLLLLAGMVLIFTP